MRAVRRKVVAACDIDGGTGVPGTQCTGGTTSCLSCVRKKDPGLDNPDRVKYIVRSLFPHVEPIQRQERSSCVVRREKLFTLEELKRADGRLKANTAPGIDGLPNEILKEVIGVYPEILLEVFNSCLREGRVFAD